MIKNYIKGIFNIYHRGDATEESFYPALSSLLENYTNSIHRCVSITQLPKRTEAGCPDFRVWDGKQRIIGYIEAKNIIETDLTRIEKTEQLTRYRHVFPNLILTNFTEFRLYRNGELIDMVQIAEPFPYHVDFTFSPGIKEEKRFYEMLNKFLSFSIPQTYKAKDLATELAKRTQFLKEIVYEELRKSPEERNERLYEFYDVFKKFLINDLNQIDFADLYSQTIVYGLFAARTRSENGFNRKLAYDQIPKTIGILREIFRYISMGDIPAQMEWIVDDISDVLAESNVFRILDEYFHQNKGSDPIVHFYETFLSEYEPETREKRGVYYTPEPIVHYIVKSVDEILKSHFGKKDGIASEDVTILDPSAGTLTFLAVAANLAINNFTNKYGSGSKEQFIKEHILNSFYAFEIMMAPYAIGHLKISFLLEEMGYKLHDNDRFKFYLTNTLEMEPIEQTSLPYISSLSKEASLANEVKKTTPILVILGNPPYSGHSVNKGEWISQEIKIYYQINGKPLGEKNPKWLQDDYVKFIRFAQWKIEQSGEGILAFITNHSYIDNPTFRGMRKSLMDSFDEVYILDLHGNSKKKEICPDVGKDENVFDIQQGVAIGIFVRKRGLNKKVYHSEIWGIREYKYEWLNNHSLNKTKWKILHPKKENYLFIPRDEKYFKKYENFTKITDIFPVNSVGIITARDHLTIKWSKEDMWNTVLHFAKLDIETARRVFSLGKDARDWKIELAQKDLIESGLSKEKIVPILYRPFDVRYTYYTGKSRGFHCRPRPKVMRNMLNGNLGLISIRRSRSSQLWNFAFVTDTIISGATAISALDINYLFPLYIYDEKGTRNKQKRRGISSLGMTWLLFEPEENYSVKKPNIDENIVEKLKTLYKKTPTPEDIFYYVYAVLYSNIYRSKYREFLKSDFPRIPFTKTFSLFTKIAKQGEQLTQLHLCKKIITSIQLQFQGEGNSTIEKVEYKNKKIYINDRQFFEGVKDEVWEYNIGGYQVLYKWLQDRKGQKLQLKDIKHFCNIAGILNETMKIQKEIDKIFENIDNEF